MINAVKDTLPAPLHFFCFISNVYKQRFFQGVEIQENISNSTPYFQLAKQRLEICLATKNQLKFTKE